MATVLETPPCRQISSGKEDTVTTESRETIEDLLAIELSLVGGGSGNVIFG